MGIMLKEIKITPFNYSRGMTIPQLVEELFTTLLGRQITQELLREIDERLKRIFLENNIKVNFIITQKETIVEISPSTLADQKVLKQLGF